MTDIPLRSLSAEEALQELEQFLERIAGQSEPIYVGIDPGASGAIALVCGAEALVLPMPTFSVAVRRAGKRSGRATEYDKETICQLFRQLQPCRQRLWVALEMVPTSLGPGRRYAEILLNRAWAMWPLFLYSHGFAVEDVRPNVWMRGFGLRGKDKKASRHKAASLFPRTPLLRGRPDGGAEALLLAEFLRRQHRAVHRNICVSQEGTIHG